jgi:hypothetical protein
MNIHDKTILREPAFERVFPLEKVELSKAAPGAMTSALSQKADLSATLRIVGFVPMNGH